MENKRSPLITILCLAAFAVIAFSMFSVVLIAISPIVREMTRTPDWYFVFSAIFVPLYIFACLNIWKMKKSGLQLLTGVVFFDSMVSLFAKEASVTILVAVLILLWTQHKKFV